MCYDIPLSQVGFLVLLESGLDWEEPGAVPEDFTFVFTEAGQTFFKNNETRELDNNVGDLDAVRRRKHVSHSVHQVQANDFISSPR